VASQGSGWTNVLMGIGDDEVSVEHDEFVAVTMKLATAGIQPGESRRDHRGDDLTSGRFTILEQEPLLIRLSLPRRHT
jgi:hypothetical protein